MPVELYAIMLLSFRVVSVWLIVDVIRKQISLRKLPVNPVAQELRDDMYQLALISISINIVPIIVDVLTLFGIGQRPAFVAPLSVIYMFSFSVGTLMLSYMIWRVYRNSLTKRYQLGGE